MKQILKALTLCLVILLNTNNSFSQSANIHVSGKYILGPCNDTLLLKGVNYAPYNWGWSTNQLRINQIALSGANCVRLPWYVTVAGGGTPQTTYNNLVYLDSALSKCIQYKMIPIVELHDETCKNVPANLITLANWYIQPAVLTLINKYKHSIILNIANEALYVSWTGTPTAAQTTFSNTYSTIVNTLRTNSITVPIMIDGSECGANLDVLANVGVALQAADPLNNLIFSAHAYWYSFAGNDSTQALNKINYALTKNIPIVFGEVANLQDDVTACQYTLTYKPWLKIMTQKKLGWLSWSWDNDVCPARQISTNGNFSSLTTYGNDIINNPIYGLSVGTVKSKYLTLGSCPVIPTSLNENTKEFEIKIYPNPNNGIFTIGNYTSYSNMSVYNMLGEQVKINKISDNKFKFENEVGGVYFVKLQTESGKVITKSFIVILN